MGQKNIALLGAMLAMAAGANAPIRVEQRSTRARAGYRTLKTGSSHSAGHHPKKLRNLKGKSR